MLQDFTINEEYTLSNTDGTANQALRTNGSGTVSWAIGASGDITGVTAGAGLTGEGTSGNVTLTAIVDNGLNVDVAADRIRLGGPLIEDTRITQGLNQMTYNLNNTGDFTIEDNGTDIFQIRDDGVAFHGDDFYWRDGSINGRTLAVLIDDGDDGRFILYENGIPSIDLDANSESTFNQQGLDRNLRVESDADANMFFVDAGLSRVGLRTNAPLGVLDIRPNNNSYGFYSNHDKTTTGTTYGVYVDLDNTFTGYATIYGGYLDAYKNGTNSGSTYGLRASGRNYQTSTSSRTIYGLYGYSYVSSTNGTTNSRGVYGTQGGNGDNEYGGYFVGNVYSTGAYQTSDRRLKSNIKNFNGALSKIAQLDVKSYDFKTKEYPMLNLPEGNQVGLISQEVQKVFPNIVKRADETAQTIPLEDAIDMGIEYRETEEEGMVEVGEDVEILALDYTKLVPVLIKATQEQQALIEKLTKRLELLENK